MQGEILSYNSTRGFGFIKNDGRSTFFHVKNVADSVILGTGDIVEFEIAPSRSHPSKTEAVNVRLIQRAPKTIDCGTFDAADAAETSTKAVR